VRGWAERLGKDAIKAIIAPALSIEEGQAAVLRLDIADDTLFVPPATSTGECAAGAMVAEHLSDLARVARQDALRAERANLSDQAGEHLEQALRLPAERLLTIAGGDPSQSAVELFDAIRQQWPLNETLQSALSDAIGVVEQRATPSDAWLPLQAWQQAADVEVERILSAVPGFLQGAAQ